MSNDEHELWRLILQDVRWYPSPHNSQPIKVKPTSATQAVLYYDKKLGLPAEDYGIAFGFVCMGTFLESLRIVAAAAGYEVKSRLVLQDMDFTAKEVLHEFAQVELRKRKATSEDKRLLAVFKKRQTSRRPYDNKLVDKRVIDGATKIAEDFGYDFQTTTNTNLIKQIIAINQKTLFDDLKRDPVYAELMEWIRFSKREAAEKADGLSAQTMLMPGRVLRFAFKHRGLWETPLIGQFFKWVYLRTMQGVRQVGWLNGPFSKPMDYVVAGQCFIRQWLYFTEHSVFLHPYGTVITNPTSHRAFVDLVQADENSGEMVWMLFRFGYSKQPPQSFRRPAQLMIIGEDVS